MIASLQQITEYQSINVIQTYPDWTSVTSYSFGDIAFDNHYYYKCVIDNNINNRPEDSPTKWLLWTVSNRYAQIDLRATTSTIWDATTATVPSDNALITRFTNNGYDLIAFGKALGSDITVNLYDDADVLIWSANETIFKRPDSNNWHGFYFDTFLDGVEQNFFFRPPIIAGGYFVVTVVTTIDSIASIGYMICGNSIFLGDSLYGANMGIDDNSQIEIDDFGITTITKRTASESLDIDVTFGSNQIQFMKRKARSLQGEVALYIGDETVDSVYEYLPILGYIEGYTSILSNSQITQGSYSIREVI